MVPCIYDTHTVERVERRRVLKFITCLQTLLFLSNIFIVHFADGGGGGGGAKMLAVFCRNFKWMIPMSVFLSF